LLPPDVFSDKNAVIGLRVIAEKMIQPGDVREGLIHSMLRNAEVDEPGSKAVPILPAARGKFLCAMTRPPIRLST
jgi:DNA-directed RNA polymerase subunit omega